MKVPVTVSFPQVHYEDLRAHLFPGDGKEAVSILLCSRRDGDRRHRLIVKEIYNIPYDSCSVRTATQIVWSVDQIADLLEKCLAEELSVLKIHSHPTGFASFSETDDRSDRELLPIISSWVEHDHIHGSAIMLPNGEVFGRYMDANEEFIPINSFCVAGDNIDFWYAEKSAQAKSFANSHAQIFGDETFNRLSKLSIAVIGCSGTGSPLVEQLVRLGVGEIVLVDDDVLEERNLNRILNSTMEDVQNNTLKVSVVGRAISSMGLGTSIIEHKENLWDASVVKSVAQCDVIFGCMDSIDGRFLLNLLATYYVIPYFDVGVAIQAIVEGEQKGSIEEACGSIHYLKPGFSSLLSRELFTMKDVAAAGLRRNDPEAYKKQLSDGYIKGVEVARPAVISINMFAASLAVNEFLARLHPYREEPNVEHACVGFSFASMELFSDREEGHCKIVSIKVGHGDSTPLLGQLELSEKRK